MDALTILQSGFLSYPSVDLVTNYPIKDTTVLQFVNLSRPDNRSDNPYHFHKEVTSIYNAYMDDNRIIGDFDYRERVLTAAKHAFNTQSLLTWCTTQSNSQFLTTMHRKFIYDTLSYIAAGYRSIELVSWINLIELRDVTDVDKRIDYNPSQYFEPILSGHRVVEQLAPVDRLGRSAMLNKDLSKCIIRWISHPTGFTDLIYSLYIIFGKRYDYTPV